MTKRTLDFFVKNDGKAVANIIRNRPQILSDGSVIGFVGHVYVRITDASFIRLARLTKDVKASSWMHGVSKIYKA